MPPKKGGKGYRDSRSLEQQLKEEDPNHDFQNEVDRLLVKHWNVDEPAKCLRWDQGKKCIFQVTAPGQEKIPEKEREQYLVFVRVIKNMVHRPEYYNIYCKEADIEERNMHYVDHLDSMNIECGSYVSPGLIKTDKLQIAVNKKCRGETLDANHCQEKEAMGAVGSYLAKMHNASRTYEAKYPKEINKVEYHESGWRESGVTKNSLHYGIIHSDFHSGNYLVRKVQEHDSLQEKSTDTEESKETSSDQGTTTTKYEVAAYDFDDIKTTWFLVDVARVIGEVIRKLSKELEGSKLLQSQQNAVNWLCEGYSEQMRQFGWSKFQVNRDHLLVLCGGNHAEVIKSSSSDNKARAAEQKYLQRMKTVRAQRKN